MSFPVQWPGESMRADWDLFFFIFNKNNYYFLTKKKKKKGGGKKDFAAARLAIISAKHCTGNKLLFKGGLIPGYLLVHFDKGAAGSGHLNTD